MTRIRPSLIRRAWAAHPLLPGLLPICRDLQSAQNELRWMVQHARQAGKNHAFLLHCVRRRANGEPLQYVLGSEFFGDLEIKCRRGVLIPRQETAAATRYLVRRLYIDGQKPSKSVKVLDLCSGSGCISLLFHHQFHLEPSLRDIPLEVTGVDISQRAVNLAKENQRLQLESIREDSKANGAGKLVSLQNMRFLRADVLNGNEGFIDAAPGQAPAVSTFFNSQLQDIDVLISNPPYISTHSLWHTTARSVRRHEPKKALVPINARSQASPHGDEFYPHLIHIGSKLRTKVLLFEVADFQQACRVASMLVEDGCWIDIEIWLDEPDHATQKRRNTVIVGVDIPVRGCGHGRSVFACRKDGQ